MTTPPMDPQNTICVIRNNAGEELGRIAATASNASEYINTLIQRARGGTVSCEEDKDAAMISRLISRRP